MIVDHIIYAAAWLSFGMIHSLLASEMAKEKLGGLAGPYYRLSYNLFAVLHIAIVIAIGHIYMEPSPYSFPAPIGYVLGIFKILGIVVMVWGARGYDPGLFAGTRQISNHRDGRSEPPDGPLVLGGLHRYVRHPIYSGAFLFLWGGVDSGTALATAAWGSVYLIVGTCFEERKLLKVYGGAYSRYCQKTPAFMPWKLF